MIYSAETDRENSQEDFAEASFGWLNLLSCPNCVGRIEPRAGDWCCSACGAVYPSAGQAPDFLSGNGEAAGIEDDYEHDRRRRAGAARRLYHELRRTFEVELIRMEAQRLGRPLDIADIGASDPTGSGTYHSRVTPLARAYLGVEPSLPLVRSALPTAKVGVVRGSGEQPLLRPNSIDVAICISALDHCLDPQLVLSNIAKALRDGGCAVIELKNASAWYRPLYEYSPRRLQRWVAPLEHAHPWNFSPQSLASRLREASFRTIETHDCAYLAPFLRTKRIDWLPRLVSSERFQRWLSRTETVGHAVAPGHGGAFVVVARK